MATMKSVVSLLILLIVLVALQSSVSEAQTCTNALVNLNTCAPFVVPGATTTAPSAECCTAIQAVDHDCICSTLRIASRMPVQCNLPPLSCAA